MSNSFSNRGGGQGPRLAQPKIGKKKPAGKKGKGKTEAKHPETEQHAKEIREVARGRDIVERKLPSLEQRPANFSKEDVLVVRSWLQRRPLEVAPTAAAMVHFPRLWTTNRGRYCRFQAPGAGVYGILRARPSF